MEMKSKTQIRRIRSQIECNHDLAERDTAIADGMCPICLLARINELEKKLELHDRSKYEMVNKQYLKQLEEMVEKLLKQCLEQIGELSDRMKQLQDELKTERQEHLMGPKFDYPKFM